MSDDTFDAKANLRKIRNTLVDPLSDEQRALLPEAQKALLRQADAMSDAIPVEVRRNPDQSIDEICIHGGNVHIEQMDHSGWYMGVEAVDGSYWQFWFGAKNGRSHVEFRHTETTPPKG